MSTTKIPRETILRALAPIVKLQDEKPLNYVHGLTDLQVTSKALCLSGEGPLGRYSVQRAHAADDPVKAMRLVTVITGKLAAAIGVQKTPAVELSANAKELVVKGSITVRVSYADAFERGALPAAPEAVHEVDGEKLQAALTRLSGIVDKASRYPGVQLRGGLAMAARTASFGATASGAPTDVTVFIPLGLVGAILSLDAGPMKLGFNKSQAIVTNADQTIVHGLSVEDMPAFEAGFAEQAKATATARIDREQLREALASSANVDRREETMWFRVKPELATFDTDEVSAAIAAVTDGEVGPVGLGPKRLLEALKVFGDSETVDIYSNGPKDHVVIRAGTGREFAVVMPMTKGEKEAA